MAPVVFKKLIAVQNSRIAEIERICSRLRDRPRDSFDLNIIASRMNALNEAWTKVRDMHEEIVAREGAVNDPYVSEGKIAHLQTLYEDTLDFLLRLKTEFTNEQVACNIVTSNNRRSSDFEPRAAKLPKLDLPSFSGQYEDWENFCDLFTTLVHDAPRLSDATKLQYLKTCLQGTAADLVKDVATTNANYAATWQALKTRFHNPRLIVYNHFRALKEIPYLKKESAVDLRSFADEAQRIIRALLHLKMPVEHWDIWLVYNLAARLDPESRKLWESELSAKDRRLIAGVSTEDGDVNVLDRFPKFAELVEFLEQRAQTLSFIAAENNSNIKATSTTKPIQGARKIHHASTSRDDVNRRIKCPLCAKNHTLYQCYKFKAKSPYERRMDVRRLQLCFNCLGQHKVSNCTSVNTCATCKERHHTSIHATPTGNNPSVGQRSEENDQVKGKNSINVHTTSTSPQRHSVILATAQIQIIGPNGECTRARALLDQGSETTFVTDAISRLVGLNTQKVNIPLSGLGTSSAGTARAATRLVVRSLRDPSFQLETDALILSKLTSKLPARRAMELNLNMFADLPLADPQFHTPDSIDVILGADVYGQLLRSKVRSFSETSLIAQDTALGWVISGPTSSIGSRRAGNKAQGACRVFHCSMQDVDLNEMLERFWILEEVPKYSNILNDAEEACENLYTKTCTRDSQGRFTVHLPLKSNIPEVATETRRMAIGSLNHMHRRFARDPVLASAYRDFMNTYESLGHMSRVPNAQLQNPRAWYLPHHAVVQNSPAGMKIRVVFDASRKTREKQCLNDFLMPGPALQRDLALILLNWRQYKYVFTADIVKMFRQIRVTPEHQDLQRILWSPSPSETPVEYRLTTVTYGTSCAPYLAIRTLNQLAEDEKHHFPLGSQCLKSNTYVDDTFAGANDLSIALRTRQELVNMLGTAGIQLDKWAANHPELIPSREPSGQVEEPKQINLDESVKTLGVQWHPANDEFRFTTIDSKSLIGATTKRAVLSSVARLFDPLGWLAPITVVAKIFMQDLWILKCGWDTTLAPEMQERWLDYCNSLQSLPSLSINRWLGASAGPNSQIHGFCDASSRAYSAAVYIRVNEGNGHYRVSLLTAKSKVAPVKTISIPNLELNGAVLLVKLIQQVSKIECFHNLPVFTWTDSQIVLTWLQKHPCNWKTFVANRVSLIQTELPRTTWSHVPTKENPADLATRGCKSIDLINADLWWSGPTWLSKEVDSWPKANPTPRILHCQATDPEPDILTRFSSLTKLTRVVAYCLRPLINLRRKRNNLEKLPEFLTAVELSRARVAVIKVAQTYAFRAEIKLLQSGKPLPKRHYLLPLNPSVDQMTGILRVGGRLTNSSLSYESKHPPILPHRSALSRLFVRHAHRACLHGGPTLTSNTVIQHAWILGRNRLVKTEIRHCISCQRAKPQFAYQMMGNLPAARVTPARPFTSAGLDYAGPIQVRTTKGRGHKSYKGYVALFVCFATKAIHIEVVSDLTAQCFLGAYRRFAGRRGVCRNLYSDNATTFQAADKELQAMFRTASNFYKEVADTLANDGTTWSFIPPNSPHYGGLWEAGVKSVKYHLKRVIGDQTLTFEELSTLLVEIEACLNSRPLCPLTSDPEDLRALTPFHFLLGDASALLPDEAPPDVPENRLDRIHLLQAIRNKFWKRWSQEYLQHLQERGKWRGPTENFAVGQLVLVRDDRYPPSKWPLARVIEIHQGPDGLVRVVTIKTATSVLRRHIARLSPLFVEKQSTVRS